MSVWLGEWDGEAAEESEGSGVLVVSQGTRGVGGLVAAGAARAERMEAEGKWGFAPPMTLLCSAGLLPPAASHKSVHQSASRCTHDQLGRSP